MASEANLRTVLSLCDPTELAQVRRVAINEALFWVYDSAWHRQNPCYHDHHHNHHHHLQQQQNQQLQTPPTTPMESQHHHNRRRSQEMSTPLPHHGPLPSPSSPPPPPPLPPPAAAATLTHTSIAASLLIDILRLVRARLPGLQELVLVPRDENPLYSTDCYLTEPAMGQNRLRRQVSEALSTAFGDGDGGGGGNSISDRSAASLPWDWKIRTLSADPDPPSYDRLVLGWCEAGADTVGGGGKDGRGGGVVGAKGSMGVTTRLGAVQESARKFLEVEMEVDVCGQ